MTDLRKRVVSGALGSAGEIWNVPAGPGRREHRRPSLQGKLWVQCGWGRRGRQLRVALGPLGLSVKARGTARG